MLCHLFPRCSKFLSSRTDFRGFRSLGGIALGAVLTLATGSAAQATTYIGEPVPTPAPGNPVPAGDDSANSPHWTDELLAILRMLCMIMGCGESSLNADGPELSAAINQLSQTVLGGGVPLLSDKNRADALDGALDAAVIVEAHADSFSVSDYAAVTATLDTIVAELARGRPQ